MNRSQSPQVRKLAAPFALWISTLLGLVSSASAQVVPELEPNDTIASAQPLPLFLDTGTSVVHGEITPGDVDFFEIHFPVDAVMNFFLQPPFPEDPPPHFFGVFDSQGTEIPVSFFYPQGTYFVGLSGLLDPGLIGAHEQEFSYALVFSYSLFPAPSGVLLFGLAALTGRRRRQGSSF